MSNVEEIKREIERLYETDPHIHITVKLSRPKLTASNVPAVIKGVYRNIFRVEENECGYARCHALQYTDVLIGQVEIAELALVRTVSVRKK